MFYIIRKQLFRFTNHDKKINKPENQQHLNQHGSPGLVYLFKIKNIAQNGCDVTTDTYNSPLGVKFTIKANSY